LSYFNVQFFCKKTGHYVTINMVEVFLKVKYMANISIAKSIRDQIISQDGRYWRVSDFPSYSGAAVAKTLSRLAEDGSLERVSKGIYYRPRITKFGHSHPSSSEIQQLPITQVLQPAGVTAANLLGFTTQNSIQGEFATSSNSVPVKITGAARLHTRRPPTWDNLSSTDAALLDFLRSHGRFSELSPEETKKRLLKLMKEADRFERLMLVAYAEPPRVQAMLGAIGQELRKSQKALKVLRDKLNPLSKFDFGILGCLKYAKEWQAK
jgi:hypothetical protein